MGPVDYWMELPITDVVNYFTELTRQVREENEAAMKH